MCTQRTSWERSPFIRPAGSRAILRAWELWGFRCSLSLILKHSYTNWNLKKIDQNLEGACACCAPAWTRHWGKFSLFSSIQWAKDDIHFLLMNIALRRDERHKLYHELCIWPACQQNLQSCILDWYANTITL